ncbi:MAG: hypothetical protein PHI59_10105, partial [Candidatus Omnitrophica bacterium]|nr:hypothetical protein [Candidatus Omnitrophota bacterium]
MKKFFIVVFIFIIAAVLGLFIYRYQIIQYSADKIIRSHLPEYIRIDKINFDAKSGKIIIGGFKILNTTGFSNSYLIEIEEA